MSTFVNAGGKLLGLYKTPTACGAPVRKFFAYSRILVAKSAHCGTGTTKYCTPRPASVVA